MRLALGAAPHIRHDDTVGVVMGDTLLALTPLVAMSVVYYGVRALALTLISVFSCIVCEYLYTRVFRRRSTISDLSAAVTGVILACCLPACVPLWFPVVGAVVAVVVAKQLFGGLGRNVFNPALVAVAFLTAGWPGAMSLFALPMRSLSLGNVDKSFTTDATVLSALRAGRVPTATLQELFTGSYAGALGTGAVLIILAAGLYLLYRRIINWQIPLAFLGTVAVLSLLFPRLPSGSRVDSMLYELLSGSLVFVAVFMATDPATSPVSSFGRLVYGVLCGLFTVLLRDLGQFPEGAFFALLLVNPFSLLLDRAGITLRRRLHALPEQAQGGMTNAGT